jgi:hypothetical protein
LAFEHECYAGSKKCAMNAKTDDHAVPDNFDKLLPEDEKAIALENMDEEGDFQQ